MKTAAERFDAKCEHLFSGCVRWRGAVNSKGYPCVWVAGRVRYAHRWAYEQAEGPIPDGLTIDHLCCEKRCVNPAHMEIVTRAENTRRRFRRPALIAAAVALALSGCVGRSVGGDFRIRAVHDDERGVTCWLSNSGIACLPDSVLKPTERL